MHKRTELNFGYGDATWYTSKTWRVPLPCLWFLPSSCTRHVDKSDSVTILLFLESLTTQEERGGRENGEIKDETNLQRLKSVSSFDSNQRWVFVTGRNSSLTIVHSHERKIATSKDYSVFRKDISGLQICGINIKSKLPDELTPLLFI